jgi:GT2 family glycosyltransferase
MNDSPGTRLSVVLPSWNVREHLRSCLRALERSEVAPGEVIVVENASTDGSAELLEHEFPAVTLLRNACNEGFTRAVNQGLQRARGEFVLLLNADAELASDALGHLVGFLEGHPAYGAAAPRLVNADGTTQRACMAFPNLWTPIFFATPLERLLPNHRELRRYFLRDFDHESERDVEQPPAACLLLRRSALERVGPLDERLWLYFSDVELSLRLARAGLPTRFVPSARVVHHTGASTRQLSNLLEQWHADRLAYYRARYGRIAGWWVKACTVFAWQGFAAEQLARKLRGEPSQSVAPVTRSLARYLRS